MKLYEVEEIRNVALLAHGGAGKTSLAEALLYTSGAINRLGRVEEETTVSDYTTDEMHRKISIKSALLYSQWQEHKINLVDTPGYADFVGEVRSVLPVVDGAIIVIDANSGVEVGTERVWNYAEEFHLGRLIFLNKMDGDNAKFYSVLEEMKKSWGNKITPLQLPLGEGNGFQGVIDILEMKAYLWGNDGKAEEKEIPEEWAEKAKKYHEELIETTAETDDGLLEKYLEEGTLSEDEVRNALSRGTHEGKIVPLLCGSAYQAKGIENLLNTIVSLLPSPLNRPAIPGKRLNAEEEVKIEAKKDSPLSALIFKTTFVPHLGELSFFRVYSGTLASGSTVYNSTRGHEERIGQIILLQGKEKEEISQLQPGDLAAVAKLKGAFTGDTLCDKKNPLLLPKVSFPQPVISLAIKPKTKKDQEKLSDALGKIGKEDPTFEVRLDHELGQTIISGMGELHLEIIINELKEKFGVEVEVEKSKVAYRETIRSTAQVQGKYKRQSGGRGQYGDVWIKVEPLPHGEGFEFVNKIVGGTIPTKYIPAVEKGVREAMQKGVLGGYPLTDIRVTLYDGSFHDVDSSDMAFHIAGSMALKKASLEAKPVLLEPIIEVEVTVPNECLGDITGDLNGRRGRIIGIEARGKNQLIKAQVPLAEMDKYSTNLRSQTKGKGRHTRKFSHYEEVPQRISEKIIAEMNKEKEE
ncbi:MAG: elongation factor G [Nitrospirae bacterium]|nr:elongation factor G [Nitrospirota bacterium]